MSTGSTSQADEAATRKLLMETQHSRLPAGEGSVDAMVGVVQTREMLAAMLAGKKFDPARTRAHGADRPRPGRRARRAGHAQGIGGAGGARPRRVRPFRRHRHAGRHTGGDHRRVPRRHRRQEEPAAVQREDGSWLLAGYMPADEMADHLGIDLPENRDYETVAGYHPVAPAPPAGDRREASMRRAGASRWSISTAGASTRCWPAGCRARIGARTDTAAQAMETNPGPAATRRDMAGPVERNRAGLAQPVHSNSRRLGYKAPPVFLPCRRRALIFRRELALPVWRGISRAGDAGPETSPRGYEVKVPSAVAELNRSTTSGQTECTGGVFSLGNKGSGLGPLFRCATFHARLTRPYPEQSSSAQSELGHINT